jgi:alpha-beta hydrolase superfamily lysophospholipase
MVEKIIWIAVGIAAASAVVYFVFGLIVAWRILKPAPRSEDVIFKDETDNHKVLEEVLLSSHTRAEFKGHNGYKLSARIYLASVKTEKWIVALHGYNNRSLTIAKYARIFNNLGYNVLAPDMRRCGESGGKTVTFGYYERKDTEDWIEYLYKTYGNITFGLFGISLGAATAILVASLRSDAKFIISYCSFSSFKDIIKARGPDYFRGIMIMYPAIVAGAYMLSRAALNTVDIAAAAGEITCPMLILHSKKDAFTPYTQSLKIS